ncbi:hypothetical protein GCM10007100_13810 [Roseibacillus persicicus]|uniref:Uncharacterized protein n=1 Tax=Roseibacillus persicicus TaxID=454148 RepID=A0A918TMU8_9BACT|nr:hypothetical protein GCM10007100_13810 [Roseibacillus persicicus]
MVAFDPLAEDSGVALVGFDAVFVFRPALGGDDMAGHSHGMELSIEDESERAGFITSDDVVSGLLLLGDPLEQGVFAAEGLRGLGGESVDLSNDDVFVEVSIDSEINDFGFWGSF